MFEHENKLENLNPEEKAKILSGVIAAHKILESNEGVREEVREDLDEVIGFFMPNVFSISLSILLTLETISLLMSFVNLYFM